MSKWTFLTHHAHVLIAVAQEPTLTVDQIAARVGITPRATAGILKDLAQEGYLDIEKHGRRNSYQVLKNNQLRHPVNSDANLAQLVELFAKSNART